MDKASFFRLLSPTMHAHVCIAGDLCHVINQRMSSSTRLRMLAPAILFASASSFADALPKPAKVPGVSETLVAAYSTVGVDFAVSTIGYVRDAQTPLVDRATADAIGSANARMIEGYHSSMRDARYGAGQFHSFINLAIVAGTLGASETLVAAPVAIPAGIVATQLNNMARDFLVANAQARASAALEAGLSRMTTEQQSLMDGLLKAGKYQEAALHFEQSTGSVSKMRSLLSEDSAAQSLLEKSLTAAMAQGSVAAIRTAAATFSKVGDLESEFVDFTKRFSDFGKKTDAALTRLESETRALSGQVTEVQGQLVDLTRSDKANGLQIALIQQVLFDQQPPSVKLAMLNQGALPGLTDEQRKTLRGALEVQEKQQAIVGSVNKVLGYARDLNTIMGGFGVSDPGVSRAISQGTVSVQALSQAFSGNYLGAVASVAGLFGGSGAPPDPMAENMKIIMAAFDGVNKRLESVLQLQQEALRAIDSLSYDLALVRRETSARFDRVDFELATLRSGQQRLIWQGLDVCESAVSNQDANLGDPPGMERASRYDAANRRFRNFDALSDYVNSHGDKAYICADYLEGVFSTFRNPAALSGNPLSLAFAESKLGSSGVPDNPPVSIVQKGSLTLVEYDLPALAYYKSRLFEPSLRVLRHGWLSGQAGNSGWGGMGNAYAMLTRPSTNSETLYARMAALATTNATERSMPCEGPRSLLGHRLQDYLCSETSTYVERPNDTGALAAADSLSAQKAEAFLGTPILRDQVGQLIDYALFVAAPRDLAKGRDKPAGYTLIELAANGRDRYGRNLLLRGLTVVDVAIAQQSMLYGDMTAYFIVDQLWDQQARRFRQTPRTVADTGVFEEAKRLLSNANNPWLQRNVAMLIIKRSQRGCDERRRGDLCLQNDFLYGLGLDRFFVTQTDGRYAPISAEQQDAGEATLRYVFDLHPDARFFAKDTTRPTDMIGVVPRTLVLSLDGFELPLPDRNDWRDGTLTYPPLMHKLLADRERTARRLATYDAFDKLDETQKEGLLTLLANEPNR